MGIYPFQLNKSVTLLICLCEGQGICLRHPCMQSWKWKISLCWSSLLPTILICYVGVTNQEHCSSRSHWNYIVANPMFFFEKKKWGKLNSHGFQQSITGQKQFYNYTTLKYIQLCLGIILMRQTCRAS